MLEKTDAKARKRRSPVGIGILVAILVLLAILAVRVYQVNSEYPPPATRIYALGETVSAGEITLLVKSAEILSLVQIQELLPGFDGGLTTPNGSSLAPDQYKLLTVTLVLKNESDVEQKIDLRFYLQSGAWSNGASLDLLMQINGDEQGLMRTVEGHGEITLVVPYLLYDFMFANPDDWATVEAREFELVLSQYPTQNLIRFHV